GHALTYLERLPEIGRIADGVSAIVHHGSLGVSEAALAGGVPQIVPTEGHFEWAWNTAVLERLGAGRRTRGAVAFAEALRAAVDDDGWARECRGLAEALERPSVSESESKVRTAAARAAAGG
ncbi:MAG: hypothetical protein JNL07_02155, partial [Rhodospirillales bacterium]|nr:hypothetical protein [Rhodospirillales bacterium]